MAQFVFKLFEDPEHQPFRVIDQNGEPWFVLTDVCAKLGIANAPDAATRLKSEEKMTIANPDSHSGGRGGARQLTIISEAGFYRLVFRSNKPEAEQFMTWVTSEVLPSIRKTGSYRSGTPAFIKRASENWDRVERGYFSVISELAISVAGRLERVGHVMADRAPDGKEIRPDGAVGRRFSDWLKIHHADKAHNYKHYTHTTPETDCEARQYPNSMLELFRHYVDEVWWPEHFEDYIKSRDPKALEFLQKLLPQRAPSPRLPRR